MNDLGWDNETPAVIEGVKGKIISDVHIVDESIRHVNWKYRLHIHFTDGDAICIEDHPRCCEGRWMCCDDDLSSFVGSTFEGIELRDGPFIEQGEEDDPENTHESGFLLVNTNLGPFTVVTHNEHNGWYSGFYLTAEKLVEQAA